MPPATVLEVMRILEKEIGLREETRSLQQAREALTDDLYGARAKPLADAQAHLARRTAKLTESIRRLPEGDAKFGKEAAVLSRVAQVMDEAFGLLSRPETGPETIATETEAIELLLQARRAKPMGSGGAGGSTPGAGGSGSTDKPALALLDVGQQQDINVPTREVEQATGVAEPSCPPSTVAVWMRTLEHWKTITPADSTRCRRVSPSPTPGE